MVAQQHGYLRYCCRNFMKVQTFGGGSAANFGVRHAVGQRLPPNLKSTCLGLFKTAPYGVIAQVLIELQGSLCLVLQIIFDFSVE